MPADLQGGGRSAATASGDQTAARDSSTPYQGECMNKDQVKGNVKDAAGKVQEEAGKVIGSTDQQRKGIHKQVEGKVQKAIGDVKEAVTDAGKK